MDGQSTTAQVEYGTVPTFDGTPSKAPTAEFTYTFAGWTPAVEAVTGDVTYTAVFDSTPNTVSITFKVDGQADVTLVVQIGQTPVFPNGTPSKAADAQYTYTFSGWDKEIAVATENAVYTAQFSKTVNKYTITWVVDGQSTTAQVEYGTVPTFNGTPSKAADAQYTYTFTGWNTTPVAVTGDATYTAEFSKTVNKYTVTWVVAGKTTTQQVEYGKTPAFNGSTDKAADAQYTYTFTGWDKAIAAVTGDVTYTAQYSNTVRKYYVYFYYGHNTVLPTIVEYGQAATAPTNTDKAPTAEFTYTFTGWNVDFSNITGTLKVYAQYTETVRSYTVTFNYGDGKTETVTVEYGKGATAPTATDKAATDAFTYTFKCWDADFSEITADLTVNAVYDEIPVKEPETTEPDTEKPEDPTEEDTTAPEAPTEPTEDPTEDPTAAPEDPTEAPTETETESETEAPVTGGCGNAWIWIVVVIVVAGAGAAAVIILLRRKNNTPAPTAPVAEAEPTEPVAPAAPLFIPLGEEIPEEEVIIPEELELVEEINVEDADALMPDKVAETFLIESDEQGGVGKMGIINVGVISAAYQSGETVDLASLQEKGMIDANIGRLKVLASGTLDKPLTIKADAFSVQAIKMIALTGGQAIHLNGDK